jgi:hypothetical protein
MRKFLIPVLSAAALLATPVLASAQTNTSVNKESRTTSAPHHNVTKKKAVHHRKAVHHKTAAKKKATHHKKAATHKMAPAKPAAAPASK